MVCTACSPTGPRGLGLGSKLDFFSEREPAKKGKKGGGPKKKGGGTLSDDGLVHTVCGTHPRRSMQKFEHTSFLPILPLPHPDPGRWREKKKGKLSAEDRRQLLNLYRKQQASVEAARLQERVRLERAFSPQALLPERTWCDVCSQCFCRNPPGFEESESKQSLNDTLIEAAGEWNTGLPLPLVRLPYKNTPGINPAHTSAEF